MTELTHIMIDMETLGVVPGCIGFSLGAVQMLPGSRQLGKEFYRVINVDSCLDRYLREEEATRDWWNRQSAEARVTLLEAEAGEGVPLVEALEDFNGWLRHLSGMKSIRIYGNGADFDNPILRVMYDAAGVKPYAYEYGGRCYRTLKNLHELFGPEFKARKMERTGTYHNALDDAKSQALHLMSIVADVKSFINYGGTGDIAS